MSNRRKIIYIHIPKTGGSTLQGIFNRNYRRSMCINTQNDRVAHEKLKTKSPSEIANIQVIKGHMAFGHHKWFDGSDNLTYVTMLRDPVKRIISNYYFILSREEHRLHKELKENNYSLKDYVRSGIASNAENAQVRLLSNNIYCPHNGCTNEMLEEAKKNLDTYFSVVGINEKFDETVLFLQQEFDWKFPYYARENVTGHGVKLTDLDQETIDTIRKYNALDIELYNYVKSNFENRIEEAGQAFQDSLLGYKRKNKMIAKLIMLKRKLLHQRNR